MNAPELSSLKRTPLFESHKALHGKLVPFGGWEMPVLYSGLVDEHVAVRTKAGLFDVSHMGEIRVAADDYLLVVNASNTPKDVAWAKSFAVAGATIEDESPGWSQIAIQGPLAQEILQPFVKADLATVAYYWFTWADVLGTRCIVSRTGYTGEDGFEVFVAPEAAPALWRAIVGAGRSHGLLPAGLGARDTLRLEARMMLYGNDMDETTSLIEAGLGWIVSLDEAKGEWNGRAALAEHKAKGAPRKLVGFEMVERGIPRHGYPVVLDGEVVSAVTSGTFAPFLQKSIGLAYLPTARAAVGTELAIDIRGRRTAARVVATPFYKRPR